MGGGRKPRSFPNVTVKPPRTQSQLVVPESGGAGASGVAGALGVPFVAQLDCQTFLLERTKGAARKATTAMRVDANVVGRVVEVRNQELGVLGYAPFSTAAIIVGAGRNQKWAGAVIGVDADRLSVEVTLCPS